jgi:hypothetical protein
LFPDVKTITPPNSLLPPWRKRAGARGEPDWHLWREVAEKPAANPRHRPQQGNPRRRSGEITPGRRKSRPIGPGWGQSRHPPTRKEEPRAKNGLWHRGCFGKETGPDGRQKSKLMKTDNTLPSGIHDLMKLADDMAGGLKRHGPWLQMTQTPEAEFRALLGRLRQTEAPYGEARAAQARAGEESIAADGALTAWLVRTRAFLTIFLGRRWSVRWLPVAGAGGRTCIPKRIEPRLALAGGILEFLAANPKCTLPGAGITPENGAALRGRLVQARRDFQAAKAESRARKEARDAAERALRQKMRQVVVILGVSITPGDARWLHFGLNRPRQSVAPRRPGTNRTTEPSPIEPVNLPCPQPAQPPPALAA